jgi:acyl transferase domain-containing protein/NAD(P)-dependent dehydrogenase (short-subunit alcohol dehydrogenase family)/acyl carrier protein
MNEPIAIIGAACRYAGGANDPEALWRLARDGVNAIGPAPSGRGNTTDEPTRRGGFLPDIDQFDPRFFGISPREANALDPQQRLLLETSYEALERAGLAVDALAGTRTGVYVGITYTDYGELQAAGREDWEVDQYVANGGALSAAAGRISFVFGFEGPSIALDTVCSSSLVAVHLAVQSLRSSECNLALAGGVCLMMRPKLTTLLAALGLMAADDLCKPFDAAADGYVRAEGCGMIALKRLSDAQAAGDPILALIRGSAVNSDGRSPGLTTPHGPAQEAVIRTALANAGLQPADIDAVEAHGTGTVVGDRIEMKALAAALAADRPADRPLLVGALKSNIGHAEAASGIAGLIKTVMALRHEQFAPTLHFRTPNPHIDWANIAVRVPTELTPWPRGPRPRRAGVSAFGFSGTNAHVILEEAPPVASATVAKSLTPQGTPRLIPFSARGEAALRALALRHAEHIASDAAVTLEDYLATMSRGRASLPDRLGVIAGSIDELRESLTRYVDGQMGPGVAVGTLRGRQRAKIAFLFTGQGAQYPGMGRGLYDSEPVFRDVVDRCSGLLASRLTRPLTELMELSTELSQTANTQPALFVFEYALAMLWRSWGVLPQWVAGHSLGEYVAACVAGVFSLEEALDLVADRGRLMQALPAGGAMAAVLASEAKVLSYLGAEVSIAAVNGPTETVISGPSASVREVLAALAADGLESRPLDVSHAFHSALLDPMLDEFEARCARVRMNAPQLPLISNLTGKAHPEGMPPDALYWRRHARETVRFAECVEALRAAGATILLEVGPHPTLLALAQRAAPEATWTLLASVRRGRDDRREMLGALQSLYVRGLDPLWPGGGRRVALPTYPFQRTRYWMPDPVRRRDHPLLGERQISPAAGGQFLATMTGREPIFQVEMARFGRLQLPLAGWLDIAYAAARASGMSGEVTVRRLDVERPLEIADGQSLHVHTAVKPEDGRSTLESRSAPCAAPHLDVRWQRHMTATLSEGRSHAENGCPPFVEAIRRCSVTFEGDLTSFGPGGARLFAIRFGDDLAVADVALPELRGTEATTYADVIGVALRLVEVLLARVQPGMALEHWIGVSVEDALLSAAPCGALRLVVCLNARGRHGGAARADVRVETTGGSIVVLLNEVALRRSDAGHAAERWPIYSLCRRWMAAREELAPFHGRYALLNEVSDSARELGATLSADLARQGATPVVLECRAGTEPDSAAIKAAFGDEPGIVIDCRALWPPAGDPPRAARLIYQRSLNLLQAVIQAGSHIGVCTLTRGALAVTAGDAVTLPATVLPGLLRSAAAEEPSRPLLLVDLDPGEPLAPEPVIRLLKTVSLWQPEVAWRGQQPWIPTFTNVAARTIEMPSIRADGTYVVSGGLGGIGLKIAAWLVDRGAGGIVLLSRKSPAAMQAEAIDTLRGFGARIDCVSCDVGDLASLDALRRGPIAKLPPIRGVFHAAGVLADALIPDQDGERFETVARSKLDGSWCLHRFTQDDPIDFFVLFSSVSGTFGAPGQANYAAANTFMDGLAEWRHSRGQPAVSVGWGPWAADGMAARLPLAQQTRMKRYGMGFLESAAALEAMASIPTTEPVVAVLAMAADRLVSQSRPGLANLLGSLDPRGDMATSSVSPSPPVALATADRTETLADAVVGELARALGFEPAALDLDAPLSDLGFDSMMAIQLRGSFASRCGVELPLRLLLQGVSTRALLAILTEQHAARLMPAALPDARITEDEVALDEGML